MRRVFLFLSSIFSYFILLNADGEQRLYRVLIQFDTNPASSHLAIRHGPDWVSWIQ